MPRRTTTAEKTSPATPQSPGSTLPGRYTPHVAGHARGPFLAASLVTPSDWKWRNTRVYTVRHSDGLDYRAIRVHSEDGDFLGYWAVELLGVPLTTFEEG